MIKSVEKVRGYCTAAPTSSGSYLERRPKNLKVYPIKT
jgi:hypothetical protein